MLGARASISSRQTGCGAPDAAVRGRRLTKASVNLDTDQVTKKTYDLAGKHISFETPLCRVRHPELHDRNFTAEAIYVDLASVSNIDALSLAFDPGDLSSIGEVLKGLVATLQETTGNEEPRLFLGGVKVPNTPDTVGPLAPTGGVLAAACQAEAPQAGEIEFLLMTQGRPIPAEAEGRIVGFARPLTGLMKGHDAVELIGDGLLLQHLARRPGKGLSGIKLALIDGPPGKPATLVQKGDLKLPHRGMHVRRAEAHRKGAAIDIRCDLETREQLQTGDGAADVDFSLFKVILTKSLRFTLLPKVDEKGCLAFEVREDPKNRAEPEHRVEFDGSVHGIKDLLKYVAAPAVVALGPAVGSFVVVFVGVVEGSPLPSRPASSMPWIPRTWRERAWACWTASTPRSNFRATRCSSFATWPNMRRGSWSAPITSTLRGFRTARSLPMRSRHSPRCSPWTTRCRPRRRSRS